MRVLKAIVKWYMKGLIYLQAARCPFIRKRYDVRNSMNINVVNLDESYASANTLVLQKGCLKIDRLRGRQVGKGQRLRLLHVIGEENVVWVPTSPIAQTTETTYHMDMNSVVFENCVKHRLLRALHGLTCVVNNTTNLSRICPTMAIRKDYIKAWLRSKNILFNEELLNPEMYELVK